MNSREISTTAQAASTVAGVLKTLLMTGATAVPGLFCYENIQDLRALDASPIKDAMKDSQSLISSSVSAFMLSVSGIDLIGQLIGTGIWSKLSLPQKLTIVTGVTLYVTGAGYAMADFGKEHNTLSAAGSAAAGVFAANVCNNFVTFFANRMNSQQSAETINSTLTEKSYLSPSNE